ncbi:MULTISPECIES: dihydropteroate synthase [Halococcus]|uniref:Probable bifunctional folylpolyglutamate synthase/dihydropteroate synthase n=1 Tax=Halococcus salifodinae DSM 8989 TaxID=1227456 RepID=M0MXQ8_9EURY|nr:MULTISPECIES: dihydropteroate synthase [Halococcus]EMA50093.1 dihydropteroate synthase [Halococcus salifodinae DSM 8989]
MEFHDAANFLFGLRRYPPKPRLSATRDLLAALDDPQDGIAFVQIAGSNGKGSTARMTESILREAGLDVGLYTSPHLDSVRERVTVNGRSITEAALAEYVEAVRPYIVDRATDGDSPTFFETITGLAFWEFARQDVDCAVLEVGIGGQYDATSVVDPVASAVTSVTLEHTDVLGDTVEEIGRDLAHVAPSDGPLVTAATGDARSGIDTVADEVVTVGSGTEDIAVSYDGRVGIEGRIELVGDDWTVETRLPLVGAHQADNAGVAVPLARHVADELGVGVEPDDLAHGLRRAHWPGRFEVMGREPLIALDGAHNPGACERLASVLDEFEYDDLHVVFGALADKDHRGMVEALPTPDRAVTCQPDIDRAEDEGVLATSFEREGVAVESRNAVTDAVAEAVAAADPNDCVVVCGSLYTVREARTRWSRLDVPKRVDDLDDARRVLSGAHVTDPGVYRMRGKTVHRTLKTRVRPRQAQYLKEELLSLGGECAVSGLNDQNEERLDVVLAGTLAQFKRLVAKLDAQPYGLGPLAADIARALDIDTASSGPDGDTALETSRPWDDGTAVMGILNVTPDSFHDGGEFDETDAAVKQAEEMVAAGADVIDIGGESTRPGAEPVSVADERDRVVPVIERIADVDALLSIDTRKAEVARAALSAGADIVNDVSGLDDPEMRFVAAEFDCPIVVMHSIDAPVDPDAEPEYDDVVEDAIRELEPLVRRCVQAGLDREQIIVDPGLGFAKTEREDFSLLGRLGEFRALDCPVLVGHSHKSMFGLVDSEAGERLPATVAASALAAERGADIVRVHDVAETVAAVSVSAATTAPQTFDRDE